jgi:endonuclease/exonuclease/phosphatase family metal-dependent hydrolase
MAASLSATTGSAAAVTNLTVMSFNIWVNGGTSLPKCIEAIRTSGADLVGLQECNAATAQNIGTNLGFYYLGTGDASIVSRYPIANIIPSGGGSGVAVELSPSQRVYLFNCHLPAYPYGPYSIRDGSNQVFVLNQENQTRMPALNQLLNTMAPYLGGDSPCFLTGDFNAPSHLDYVNYPWPTSVAPIQAGLVDSYRSLHPENRLYPPAFAYNDPGITWTPRTDQEPRSAFDRIDFVYFSNGDGITATQSVELDARNSANPWPSDHRAVLTRFVLTPPTLAIEATHPLPADGATGVPTAPVLTWLAGSNAVSHDVYFGTAGTGTFQTNTTNSSFAPGMLTPGVTYIWRVDEHTPDAVITGALWSFTTQPVRIYEWTFSGGNLAPALGNGVMSYADGATTSNLTSFGISDGATVPHINGRPATYLRVPGFTSQANGFLVTLTGSTPNGGGAYINQFTMIWDLLLPGSVGWTPLMNTNPQNANDADFYIDPLERLGIGAIGYSANGLIASNTWYRIIFAADLPAGTVKYYLNGNLVFTGAAGLDGRHSLYSDVDAGPDLFLFNEGDTSGTYTHAVLVSSFAFTDRTLSAAQAQALGGPADLGIFVTSLPPVSIRRDVAGVRLDWNGLPGVRLQKSSSLSPAVWSDVPGTMGASTFTDGVTHAAAFYRLAR